MIVRASKIKFSHTTDNYINPNCYILYMPTEPKLVITTSIGRLFTTKDISVTNNTNTVQYTHYLADYQESCGITLFQENIN